MQLTFLGFGKSDEPKEVWDVDKYTDLTEKFIQKMDLHHLSLLGHSFGGRVIIKLVNRDNLKFKINKLVTTWIKIKNNLDTLKCYPRPKVV